MVDNPARVADTALAREFSCAGIAAPNCGGAEWANHGTGLATPAEPVSKKILGSE